MSRWSGLLALVTWRWAQYEEVTHPLRLCASYTRLCTPYFLFTMLFFTYYVARCHKFAHTNHVHHTLFLKRCHTNKKHTQTHTHMNTQTHTGTDGSVLTLRGMPTPNIFAGWHEAHGKSEFARVRAHFVCLCEGGGGEILERVQMSFGWCNHSER